MVELQWTRRKAWVYLAKQKSFRVKMRKWEKLNVLVRAEWSRLATNVTSGTEVAP